ncbi:nickel-binding protein Mua [Helicobacter cappadocius]|uniref:Nickel-binding protein Mua n=1 Tax=Helicobacter cappadocius TaxID=3063998 RepID=A0AA90PKN0_9HELI|nr:MULTISPECIES: nickel-binding protein Mua [unclassified Helicobacter]MDO7253827.1 nickel-binding protein Mua [Helicobacter sp. faydin-H75]MDP2539716.1 nickel-binding protein Mua [Helicobacter sp. faydin-H76]
MKEDRQIFQEFVQKSSEIKETWEIAKLFEEEREKFKQELLNYENEIKQAKKFLKDFRAESSRIKEEIKELEELKLKRIQEIQALREEVFKQKIKKKISKLKVEKDEIQHEKKDEILPKPVEMIDIYLKDGSVAKARPTKKVYTDTLYKKYRVVLKENKSLKDRILEFELENSKLKIELRDFYTEDMLKTNNKSKED